MKITRRIKRNYDIRKNEPIRQASEARERVTNRSRRSKRVGVGLMTLAIGFGVLGAESAGVKPIITDAATSADTGKPKNEPLSKIADLGLLATLGGAYAERKLLRRSTRQTVKKFRTGLGIPSGGEFELNLVETEDGGTSFEEVPSFVGAKTRSIDMTASLPSLGAWVSGGLIDQAALETVLDPSIRIGFGMTGAFFLAGAVAIEGMMHTDISHIEQDTLRKIDQLDPNLVKE